MQTFTDLLHSIGKKPGLYLGSANSSITHLKTLITGFQCGQRLHDDTSVLDSFTFWVCHHYGVPDGARDWSGHLLERAGGDEAAAFRLFFQHFDEYLKERETIGAEAIKARFITMLEQMHKDEDNAA